MSPSQERQDRLRSRTGGRAREIQPPRSKRPRPIVANWPASSKRSMPTVAPSSSSAKPSSRPWRRPATRSSIDSWRQRKRRPNGTRASLRRLGGVAGRQKHDLADSHKRGDASRVELAALRETLEKTQVLLARRRRRTKPYHGRRAACRQAALAEARLADRAARATDFGLTARFVRGPGKCEHRGHSRQRQRGVGRGPIANRALENRSPKSAASWNMRKRRRPGMPRRIKQGEGYRRPRARCARPNSRERRLGR